ncbi:MAG: cytochrome P450 [Tatlockia sp.]|jgi:cytochrome P450
MPKDKKPSPKKDQLTARDAHYRDNMHEILDSIREQSPSYKDENFKRWVVTTYQGVQGVLKNTTGCGRDASVSAEDTWGRVLAQNPKGAFGMLDVDGEEHRRLRSSITKEFSPKQVALLSPMIECVANELIDKLKALDSFDLIESLAAPFPTIVISNVLGVDKKDQEQFKRWSNEWVHNIGPGVSKEAAAQGEKAYRSLSDYFDKAVQDRANQDTGDLLSRLIHQQDAQCQLSSQEIVTLSLLLILAGNLTSTDVIGNGIVALIKHPGELNRLQENPALIAQATEEILRFDAPITETIRFLNTPVEVEDVSIDEGQTLMLNLAAANHDPKVFHCPHQFDILREGPPHVAFGGGTHLCLGIHLARLEIQIILKKFLEAFPSIHLMEEPERKAVSLFNGYKAVWLSVKPQ